MAGTMDKSRRTRIVRGKALLEGIWWYEGADAGIMRMWGDVSAGEG